MRKLRDRAYHAVHCQCVCGNELSFIESCNAMCDECGAMYVPMGGDTKGCPQVGDNFTVTETFLLDPHTVDDTVLKRLGQIELEHTFVWEML